jgi:hypothetical protein
VRIVSRITYERNVEAIHRAGADFVLSYTSLGVEAVLSILRGHDLVLLGEGVELFSIPVPASLADRPLRESGIGSKTGLSVVAHARHRRHPRHRPRHLREVQVAGVGVDCPPWRAVPRAGR